MAFIEEHQYSIWEEGWKQPKPPMNVLVACEESQAVCKAFRARGHNAFSCDIQECSGGHPEWHIKGDVLKLLKAHWMSGFRGLNGEEYWGYEFETQDGCYHYIMQKWDLIIAHPPCTDLAVSGARWFKQKQADGRQKRSIEFFMRFTDIGCKMVAIENPIGIMSEIYRKPDQIINPYEYGHPEMKSTCLWLKGLPPLLSTNNVKHEMEKLPKKQQQAIWWMGSGHSKERSKTYPGIAKAMAEQWG